jgi:hypothetical protein
LFWHDDIAVAASRISAKRVEDMATSQQARPDRPIITCTARLARE